MNENFLTDDKGYDVWEFEETNDNMRKLENKESLDTVVSISVRLKSYRHRHSLHKKTTCIMIFFSFSLVTYVLPRSKVLN